MKFLEKITRKEARFQRYIGLNLKQLDLLTIKIEALWKIAEYNRLKRPGRKRKVGAGHPYELKTIKDKIITVLLYYKLYVTQEFLGDLIGIDQANISRLLNKMLPLIEEAADPELKTYLSQAKNACKNRINSFEELTKEFPDLKDVSSDATEQAVYRSSDYKTQKKYYSGKSKQHAMKTQISVSAQGRILDVSASYPSTVHDKALIDQEKTITKFDERVPHRFDSGYQGVVKDNPKHYLILPFKKPKNKELSELQKEHNRANSRRRVKAEHAIARLKKYRILSGVYRQPLYDYNQTFRNIAALLNFRRNNSAYAC
jgi:DDE superfamily endonuclease/Helix-turn-helix of DDE superfamily endonuclease